MKAKIIAGIIACMVLVGLCAPRSAQAQTQGTIHVAAVSAQSTDASRAQLFDKTRFLLHAGAAYFAFHHFVYKRYQEGGFAANASGRKTNFVKAAIALVFAYHELHVAYNIANGSHSKTLHLLVSPINKLLSLFDAEKTKLSNGNYNPSDLTNLNSAATSLANQASNAGYGIKDVSVPVPGAS